MQLTIIEYSNDILEAKEKEITVYIADFDTGVGAVPLSVIDAKGDLIVGVSSDQITRLPVGTNDHVLTADSSATSGIKWAAPAGTIASLERESKTLTGNLTLYDADKKYLFIDPGGADRTIILPAAADTNHFFTILNTADAFETLTVKNAGGTTIAIIPRAATVTFFSSGSAWFSASGRYKQLWIGNWKPTVTSGCGAQSPLEMTTNKNNYDYNPFDASTVEKGYQNVAMPDDYMGGNVYAMFYWTHPPTTVNFGVSWGLQAVAMSDDDPLDVAQGTAQYANDVGGTTYDLYKSPMTAAITIGGTPAAGDLVNWVVSRKADDVTYDTLAVDAYLLGVMVWYPVG